MSVDAITAIRSSLPPETDYLTYLTILESHLSPDILPTLNELLQDATLTQNIGWDLIQLLIPLPGAEACLSTIARLGNPREVVLKVTEALRVQSWDDDQDDDGAVSGDGVDKVPAQGGEGTVAYPSAPSKVDKFCTLVSLLATLHPRIKTKYPSRFLSTSLMAILASYRPSAQATAAVIAFLHSLSGNKRPPLPQRKSSLSVALQAETNSDASAPDPEATAEEPHEGAIQQKLLQSFVTHVLEEYINLNLLEWSARLQENFAPEKVVPGRRSMSEAFKEDLALVDRDMTVGQLVALARDLQLSGYEILFDAIYAESKPESEEYPSSPDEVPLSKGGSLFLLTCFIFSSVIFDATLQPLPLSIFPGHASLLQRFTGPNGPTTIGSEEPTIIDSLLAIGLFLEKSNKFVSGPLEDEDFLQYLQTLSLLSANTPVPTLRYAAHSLLSSVLHAHPVDRTRLTFITDTLENCPYDALKASAVSWLKDELITAHTRAAPTDPSSSSPPSPPISLFATPAALTATQPYLFPNTSALAQATPTDLWQDFQQTFPFHMAVLNFLVFLRGEQYASIVPPAMLTVAEEIYLGPLREAQARLRAALEEGGEVAKGMEAVEVEVARAEVALLGERLGWCLE